MRTVDGSWLPLELVARSTPDRPRLRTKHGSSRRCEEERPS